MALAAIKLQWLTVLVWSALQFLMGGGAPQWPWKERRSGFYSGPFRTEILQWAVKVDPNVWPKSTVEEVAQYLDMHHEGKISGSTNVFLFTHELHKKHSRNKTLFHSHSHPNPLSDLWPSFHVNPTTWEELKQTTRDKLDIHPQVIWYMQQVVRSRSRRDLHLLFNDPEYTRQWHLHNIRNPHIDLEVTKVWQRNVSGFGVTTAVLDDGLEWSHPDLKPNYCAECSFDLNDNDPDPSPSRSKVTNHHGTRCAGEIAAVADNGICGVGIAYNARIAGLRILGGPMTDSLEALAFTTNMELIDVYSCSWGPDDDGKTVDGPHYLAEHAMREAVNYGRKGYGNIFVVASGNGGLNGDNCNFDGYATSIYTVTIGAVNEAGAMPYYAEECACMLAVTFSSGRLGMPAITTTDWYAFNSTGCTNMHSGTSAAAPLAAGMIALMLQVQPCLTWRDVQHIIVMSAVKVDVDPGQWQRNAAGLHHSHKHGFGLMNAWKLVNAAKIWTPVPWLTSYSSEEFHPNIEIPPRNKPLNSNLTVTADMMDGYNLFSLEYVHVKITVKHQQRGNLKIRMVCPSGTVSVLAATRIKDKSKDGFRGWTFSTVRCWGEPPLGNWKLTIQDQSRTPYSLGQLISWQLIMYGSPMTPKQFKHRLRAVRHATDNSALDQNITSKCHPPPVHQEPVEGISEKTLKILVLTGAFCIIMAIYETFEYMFCYGDEKKAYQRWLRDQLRQQDGHEGIEETSLGNVTESTGLLAGDALTYNGASSDVSAGTSLAGDGPSSTTHDNASSHTNTSHVTSSYPAVSPQTSQEASSQSLPHTSSKTVAADANIKPKPKRGADKILPPKDNVLMHVPKSPQYVSMETFDDFSDEDDDLLFNSRQHLLINR